MKKIMPVPPSMRKLTIAVYAFFLLAMLFSAETTMAGNIELYDRDSINSGTVMAEFAALVSDPLPNGQFTPTSTMPDTASFSGSYTRGYPEDYSWITPSANTYARSTLDFTNGSISSKLKYNTGANLFGNTFYSRIDIYTKALPSSYSLSGTSGTFNSRFIIQLFDKSSASLGFMILSRMGGQGDNYQLGVFSSNDSRNPLFNWQWIPSNQAPNQSDLLSYVNWIVNGRSADFYYKIGAEVSSGDINAADVNATLNFGNNPVPIPAAVWLFGTGLLGLFGVRRKIGK